MSLASTYGPEKFGLSFELYPPKTDKGESLLIAHLELLMACKPNFITCTYGAGGSTRQRTLDIIALIKQQFDVPVASHLTCVGSSVEQLRAYLIRQSGWEWITSSPCVATRRVERRHFTFPKMDLGTPTSWWL